MLNLEAIEGYLANHADKGDDAAKSLHQMVKRALTHKAVAIVTIAKGQVESVMANSEMRLILIDKDTDGASESSLVQINGKPCFVHDHAIDEDGLRENDVRSVLLQLDIPTGVPSEQLKATVLQTVYSQDGVKPLQGYRFLAASHRKTGAAIVVVAGNFGRDHFQLALAEAKAAGLTDKRMYVYGQTATYSGRMICFSKFEEIGISQEHSPAKAPKSSTEYQLDAARTAGYTVHAANDASQGWSFCIDGQYSEEFPTEEAAWAAAVVEHEANEVLRLYATGGLTTEMDRNMARFKLDRARASRKGLELLPSVEGPYAFDPSEQRVLGRRKSEGYLEAIKPDQVQNELAVATTAAIELGSSIHTPVAALAGYKPGEWGTKDGLPAMVWWRYGVAHRGEPQIVSVVQTYPTEADRFAAYEASAGPVEATANEA